MALTFGFYNSVNGDRKYDARDFAGVFDAIMDEGVTRGFGQEFAIVPTGGRAFTVGAGRAWYLKTWSFNDAPVPFTLDVADAAQPRIDTVVLEVNTADAARANILKIIKGSPNATPVAPALTNNGILRQVPLYDIRLAANAASFTAANVTKRIGAGPDSPYSTTRLLNPAVEPAAMHRNVIRGKYLGNVYTTDQKNAVINGTFDDLYIGDYWTINGVNWRIVDMDYYYHDPFPDGIIGTEWNNTGRHHLVIMPDKCIWRGKMNENASKMNAGAYENADMRAGHLTNMTDVVKAAFGAANLVTWSDLVSRTLTDGRISASFWANFLLVELPNQVQIFGHDLWSPRGRGEDPPPVAQSASTVQFKLFNLAPKFIRATNPAAEDRTYFLRDVISTGSWAAVESSGGNSAAPSHVQYGFRPYFCI